jgi:galactitol-specific phosphotransferase system IIB component
MTETINKILENSRLAYKKSILIDNVELEELLFSIITDSKKLLDKLNDKEKEMINISQNRTENEEIKRVKKKIPSWFSKPNQYNHKILVAYMELSNRDTKPVKIEELEKKSGLKNSQIFISNFNQMKIISYKNHGKVFSEENGLITLWSPISDFIRTEYEIFCN